jgi:CoA-dependent NAD(P)H sulfur oxidoreductase
MTPEAIRKNGKLLVIGGVAAGMSAASQAKRRRPDLDVTALEKGDFVSYGACGMPYNIEDPARDMEDLVVITPEQFRKKRGINVLTRHEALAIDRQKRIVTTQTPEGEKSFSYDRLVIATGARSREIDIKGADLPGVHFLHTLAHGKALKEDIAALPDGSPILIMGAGYIAMEMAEVFTRRGFAVRVWSRSKVVRPLADSIRQKVLDSLGQNGVEVVYGQVARIEAGSDGRACAVSMEDGKSYEARLVLIAIGVAANTQLAQDAALSIGKTGAIAVNEFLQTSDPLIYAAGDCAEHSFQLGGDPIHAPLGDVANKQGKIAGANVVGAGDIFPGVLGTAIFRVFDLEVAMTGLNEGQAKARGFSPLAAEITGRTRAHAYPGAREFTVRIVFDADRGRLLGAQIAAGEGAWRINVLSAAIYAGFTVDKLAGIDMAYAPPFSPVWDPILTLATQAQKALAKHKAQAI